MTWKKTGCSLCGNGCGLEVEVENNRIVKVRGDKANPVSEGYICRKGVNLASHVHNKDRVLHPLKKVSGGFEQISWEQAIDEISTKLKGILDEHGPRSLASVVGGGEMGLGLKGGSIQRIIRGLGSKYYYSSGNQEFAGRYWAHGLTMGDQSTAFMQDDDNSDMMILLGKNPMQSHNFQQSRRRLNAMHKDPDKLLVVIDPRLTETAKVADIHLAIRPGTDALLLKSMIAIILREELHNQEYIAAHVDGFAEIMPWFADFDVRAALDVCELDYDQVVEISRQFATRQSCLHDDLGILMGRHSALVSYLIVVLLAICGRLNTPGGNYVMRGVFRFLDGDNDWRTMATDIPALNGSFPPNVLPEEILADNPDRLRAVIVHSANPLRSYADTTAFEEAFSKLDLLVVVEIAMSETAALADYILPAKSGYESWTGSTMINFPKIYHRALASVVEAEGEQKEALEIFSLLADALGLIPEIPASLHTAAESGDLMAYAGALSAYVNENPAGKAVQDFIVARTLGKALGSAHLAAHFATYKDWAYPPMPDMAAAVGFEAGPDLGQRVYRATIDHPEGVLTMILPLEYTAVIPTANGRAQLHNQEAEDWMGQIDAATEEALLQPDPEFPLILMAGRHMDTNASTSMRDPAWNEGRRVCTLAMNPADAEILGFTDGQTVKITTEAADEDIELEVTAAARKGQVIIPHGFGLVYDGVKYGVNVNRLTKASHRDKFGTPMHRYVPCRVEAL